MKHSLSRALAVSLVVLAPSVFAGPIATTMIFPEGAAPLSTAAPAPISGGIGFAAVIGALRGGIEPAPAALPATVPVSVAAPAAAPAASVPAMAEAMAPALEAAVKPETSAGGAFAAGRAIEDVMTGGSSAAAPAVSEDRVRGDAAAVATYRGENKPYAQDFASAYAKLKQDGATKEQLDHFVTLAHAAQPRGAGFAPAREAAKPASPAKALKVSGNEIAGLAKSFAASKGGEHMSFSRWNEERYYAAASLESRGATKRQIARFYALTDAAPEVNGGFSNYAGD